MNLKDQMNGIQHVGVPTNDIETTIKFYEALGFEIAFQTVNEAANEKVAFLKLGNLVIETYENKAAKMESGAIDHVAIDVKDVEKVHELVTAAGSWFKFYTRYHSFPAILGKWSEVLYN